MSSKQFNKVYEFIWIYDNAQTYQRIQYELLEIL